MAIPKILQQLNAPIQGNLRQVASVMRGDPTALLQRMQNTPQMREAQRLINSAGGDARKAFFDLAAARGVDPDEVLRLLR